MLSKRVFTIFCLGLGFAALAAVARATATPAAPYERVEPQNQPENTYTVTVDGRAMRCRVYEVPGEPGVRCSLCLHTSKSFGSQGCWSAGGSRVGP